EALDLLGGQEPDRRGVDVDRALDAAAAALEHAPPVLEAVLQELVRGDDGDRLVPVTDLHVVERDVDDVAVGIELRHLDPVADAHEVVVRELHTGDEGEQRITEDEQDDGHHRAQAAHEVPRRAAGQAGDDEDDGYRIEEDLRELYVALDGPAIGEREPLVEGVAGGERRIQDEGAGEYEGGAQQPQGQVEHERADAGHEAQAGLQHDQRNERGRAQQDAPVE